MSTLSAQLLVCSSSLTQDIYKTFIRRAASQPELVWFGRAMVLFIALIAIWLAWNPDSLVLAMVSYAWAGFGAAFGPVIILSLVWSRMTRHVDIVVLMIGSDCVLDMSPYVW